MHSTKFLSVVFSTARSIILRGDYLLSDPTRYSFYLLLHGPHLLCGPTYYAIPNYHVVLNYYTIAGWERQQRFV